MAIITMLGYGTHYIWHAREYFTYVQSAKLAASINHSLKDVDLTCEGLKQAVRRGWCDSNSAVVLRSLYQTVIPGGRRTQYLRRRQPAEIGHETTFTQTARHHHHNNNAHGPPTTPPLGPARASCHGRPADRPILSQAGQQHAACSTARTRAHSSPASLGVCTSMLPVLSRLDPSDPQATPRESRRNNEPTTLSVPEVFQSRSKLTL